MGLMDIFADPSKFDTLSLGDKVIGSLVTAMMGMGVTFIVLILIWGFIAMVGKIVRKDETSAKKEPVDVPLASAPSVAAANSVSAGTASGTANQDEALIAVIMAAILAAEGSTFTNNLVIKKIRRIPGPDPIWSHAGRNESLDSRRV